MIRAPPKSGKTFLGKLAHRVPAVSGSGFSVEFCPFLQNIDDFVVEKKFHNVRTMAQHSGDKKVIYYFDETHDIPDGVTQYFVKEQLGYAVFASSGLAKQTDSNITPAELQQNMFQYRSPAEPAQVSRWLTGRIAKLFTMEQDSPDVRMAADLLMNVSDGHVGIIQFVGVQLERARCFESVRESLARLLSTEVATLWGARCFGLENGRPNDEQMMLISRLRCSGDTGGEFDFSNPSHRRGLSQAYYAPIVQTDSSIAKVAATSAMSFVHPLQPMLYKMKFDVEKQWRDCSHCDRWVVDFQREDSEEPTTSPTNVIDLVVSWLSHTTTEDLLNAEHNVDASECDFQTSFAKFHSRELQLPGKREVPAHWANGKFSGYLDHLVDSNMGVEFLIRTSAKNRFSATDILTGQTRKSLIEHAARADESTATGHSVASYADIAAKCTKGYITVLPATVTTTTDDAEYKHFGELIAELQQNKADAPILNHNIMVAVATFGWAKWDVFLWDPVLKKCVRFEIKRQRLMYKVVDGQAVTARHFYPRPTDVWAQELLLEGGGSPKLTGKAFEVKPEKDSVASLAEGIVAKKKSLKCDVDELTIYSQSRTGVWKELEKPSQVLYANADEKPYGFVVPAAVA